MGLHYNKQEGYFVAICDECDFVCDLEDAETFDDALSEIESDGWTKSKEGERWVNCCPDCQ